VHYTHVDLHSATRDIAEREERIADLERLIAHLRRNGRSTIAAQQLLETIRATQTLSIAHRDMVAALLAQRTKSR